MLTRSAREGPPPHKPAVFVTDDLVGSIARPSGDGDITVVEILLKEALATFELVSAITDSV